MKKKIAIIIAVILVVIFFKTRGGGKIEYSEISVPCTDLVQTVSTSGKIQSQNSADLAFQTSGKLTWVGVKKQDRVKKWQAIASLDTRSVQENIKKTLLAYMNQRWTFEQTQSDYQNKKDNYTITDAEKRILEKAQFNLDSTVADVEIADLARQNAVLVSPIEGIVTQVNTPVAGVNITAGVTLFSIIDPSAIIFEATVDELDIGKISLGQKTKISLDAYPQETFEGTVTKIGFAALSTSGGGTAFPVEISLPPSSDLKFKIGMNGDAEMLIQEKKGVLTIPSNAIFFDDGKKYVWTINEEKLEKKEIITGLETDESAEVISGIKEGDKIVEDASKIPDKISK